MVTGRPQKEPWKVTWNTYNSKFHLIGTFYNDSHERIRVKTGTRDHFTALEKVTERMKQLKEASVFLGDNMTLKQAFSRMTEEVWQFQKDHKKRIREAERISEWFGQNFLLKDIDEESLSKFTLYLRGLNNHGATINRKMAIVKSTLNKAFRYWRIIDRVPAFSHHKEKVGGHKRMVTKKEIGAIIFSSDALHGLLFDLMYQTGMRVSECLNIEKSQIDTKHFTIRLYDSKAGEDETVVVPKRIFLFLRSYLIEFGDIHTDESRIRTQWNRGRRVLGLMDDKKFTPGALRHTFALQLTREGMSAPVVQAFLRHKTIITTQHYFKQNQQELLRIRDEREESE